MRVCVVYDCVCVYDCVYLCVHALFMCVLCVGESEHESTRERDTEKHTPLAAYEREEERDQDGM